MKYLFLHNPKCAGSTVHSYLPEEKWHNLIAPLSSRNYSSDQAKKAMALGYHCKPHHYNLEQHKNMEFFDQEEISKAWKFTYVRNPFDRVVSAYHYSRDTYDGSSSDYDPKSFASFVNSLQDNVLSKKYYEWLGPVQPNHVSPQHLYVYDSEGVAIPDYVGRHETFDFDTKNILDHLGFDIPEKIAVVNATPKRKNYRKYYDVSTRKIIEKTYEKDLNLFKYEF